jgi:serine/threonine protein kinase
VRSTLADYQILGPAGPGGDSWLAETPARLGGGAPVVVTRLVTRMGPGGDDWSDLSGRLLSLATVRSSYLPRLIDAGQTDEEDEVVTWVAREDGRPEETAGPASDPGTALRRLAAAARGLHDLHEAGWAHGDIQPRSVLQRGDDTLLEPPVRALAKGGSVTPPGTLPGELDTVDRAVLWGEGPSRATDIWALGATAHRVLTGDFVHPAVEKDLVVTAVRRVLFEAPVVSPTLAPEVARLLRSCLAVYPAERPATAADLADDFDRLAGQR